MLDGFSWLHAVVIYGFDFLSFGMLLLVIFRSCVAYFSSKSAVSRVTHISGFLSVYLICFLNLLELIWSILEKQEASDNSSELVTVGDTAFYSCKNEKETVFTCST